MDNDSSTDKEQGSGRPDNPTAFPTSMYHTGMTLRDWFAGQALAAVFAEWPHIGAAAQAVGAFKLADAMLRHREVR